MNRSSPAHSTAGATWPIAVVGAGPAGQAAALALAGAGYPVHLVDAGPGPAPAPEAADR